MFETLNSQVQQEIFTGHKVTSPMIFGVKTEGQLGGRTEVIDSFELFYNGYVQPKQKIIIDLFNYILSLNGFEKRFSIMKTEPVTEKLTEQTIVSVMTRAEIREKAGLPPEEVTMKSDFSTHVFSLFGKPKKDYKILRSKEAHFHSLEDAKISELNLYRSNFKEFDLPEVERSILDLINKNPKIEVSEIATVLKISTDEVLKKLDSLKTQGLLIEGENGLTVSKDGQDSIGTTEEIEIMYSYEVRAGLGEDIIETTRDFCRNIPRDKLYLREDIETISQRTGRDVWRTRGGFYHNPNTDITTPSCRHVWKQNIVRKNG
jgi:DNA-binding Lrp family transcriptional regulator